MDYHWGCVKQSGRGGGGDEDTDDDGSAWAARGSRIAPLCFGQEEMATLLS